jgi:hypothetical protein
VGFPQLFKGTPGLSPTTLEIFDSTFNISNNYFNILTNKIKHGNKIQHSRFNIFLSSSSLGHSFFFLRTGITGAPGGGEPCGARACGHGSPRGPADRSFGGQRRPREGAPWPEAAGAGTVARRRACWRTRVRSLGVPSNGGELLHEFQTLKAK